jgi:hypothetical protein
MSLCDCRSGERAKGEGQPLCRSARNHGLEESVPVLVTRSAVQRIRTELGKAVLYGFDIGAHDVCGLYTEDRCPSPVVSPFPLSDPSLAPVRAACRLPDHAQTQLSLPAQMFSA